MNEKAGREDARLAGLLTALRGMEIFSGSSWREVKGLPPIILVELGDDVEESTHHLRLTAQKTITVLSRGEFLEFEEVVERLPQAAAAVRLNETATPSLFGPVIFTPGRFGHGAHVIPGWSITSDG